MATWHHSAKTRLLDRAITAARHLSPAAQDEIAGIVLRLTGADDGSGPVTLSPDEQEAMAGSQAAAARGDFATDEQVRAAWAKHRL